MGECAGYRSQQADSIKVKFATWPTSWRPARRSPTFTKRTKVNSRKWLRAVDDITHWHGSARVF